MITSFEKLRASQLAVRAVAFDLRKDIFPAILRNDSALIDTWVKTNPQVYRPERTVDEGETARSRYFCAKKNKKKT